MEDEERLLAKEEEEERKREGELELELETKPDPPRKGWRRLLHGRVLLGEQRMLHVHVACFYIFILTLHVAEQVFPVLTTTTSNVKLNYKRSFVITSILYISHILSAWVGSQTAAVSSSSFDSFLSEQSTFPILQSQTQCDIICFPPGRQNVDVCSVVVPCPGVPRLSTLASYLWLHHKLLCGYFRHCCGRYGGCIP